MSQITDTSAIFNDDARAAFLDKAGWEVTAPMGKDTSIRRYFRCGKNGKSAILMESVPDDSPLMSRGHKMADFIKISKWLNEAGLNAPQVYQADPEMGYMLLEDFGDVSLKQALDNGGDKATLYGLASDVLKHLQAITAPEDLPDYYTSRVHDSRDCILKFYVPEPLRNREDIAAAYFAAWDEIEKTLPEYKKAFIHMDYHSENLMLLEHESGLARIGILDFQGAMIGHPAYDLANLLEDARADVPPEIRDHILSRYDEEFKAHYRVLATQFHCRVIGQFIKIAEEQGNKSYLKHIPRLEHYIRNALKDPLLRPLKTFFDNFGLDF